MPQPRSTADANRYRTGLLGFVLVVALIAIAGCGSQSVSEKIDRAAKSMRNGKTQDAKVRLKQILQSHEKNARAWLLLARISLDQYRYADAAHQFRQAARYGENTQQFALAEARAQIGDRQFDAALKTLDGFNAGDDAARVRKARLRGNALYAQGHPNKAGAAYAKALAIDPDNAEARVGQARLAAAAGDTKKARSLLQQTLEAHPQSALAASTLGRVEYNASNCRAAEPHLKRALDRGQQQTQALSPLAAFRARALLADCQLRSGQTKDAKANVARLMEIAPDNPYANYLQAMVDIRAQDYAAATTHLQNLLRVNSDSTRAKTLLAAVKIADGDLDSARLYLQQVLAQSPGDVRALRMRAGLLMHSGKKQQALKMVQRAYDNRPGSRSLRNLLAQTLAATGKNSGDAAKSDALLQLDLANILQRQGNLGAARTVLDNIRPSNADQKARKLAAEVNLALAAGQVDAALAKANKGVDAAPESATALLALARAQWAAGQKDRSHQTLLRAQKHAPDNDRLALMLASIDLADQRFDAAQKQLDPVLDRAPDNTAAIMAMAEVYAGRGQNNRLVDWLQNAYAEQPDSVRLGRGLIKALLVTGAAQKAVPIAEQLVDQNPKNAGVVRLAGAIHFATGDQQKGVQQLQKAVDMAPDRPAYALDLARARLAQGDTRAALQGLKKLRDKRPGWAPAARLLASAQLKTGDTDAALATAASLGRADDANKAVSAALRGDILFRAKRYAEAGQAYADALAAAPSRSLALRLFNARRLAGAEAPARALVRWLKKTPQDVGVRLRLAQWYQHQGARARAKQQYRAVLGQAGANPVALNNLALLQSDDNRDQAIALARRAHRAAPKSPAIADTLGWLLVQNGEVESALGLLKQAAENAGPNAEIRYHYAYALAQSSDSARHKQAAALIEEMLQNKTSATLKQKLESLRSKLPGQQASLQFGTGDAVRSRCRGRAAWCGPATARAAWPDVFYPATSAVRRIIAARAAARRLTFG